jgi:quercetin dioxygenase-like cupin family protein
MLKRATFISFLMISAHVSGLPQAAEIKPGILVIDTAKVTSSDFTNQSVKFMVTAAETEGRMTVFETTEHPGYKTQWHSHNNSEETFYILEGTLTIKAGGKTYHARQGSFVYIPRGTPHGQGNFTDKPVRFVTTFTPGGAEIFFRERNVALKGLKPTDPNYAKLLQQVREKHRFWIEPLGTWEPDSKPGSIRK